MNATSIELPRCECIALLGRTPIGRLCIIDGVTPIALPVNFKVDVNENQHRLVVRTAPSTILGRYQGPCAFEADHFDLATGSAWSVLVRGTVRRVLGHHDLLDPEPLVGSNRVLWLVIDVSAISGRRFTVKRVDEFTVDWAFA